MIVLATSTTPNTNRLATFRLDARYTRIASALGAAGIETILLKGPALDQLLFDGRRSRTYADIDLLVAPARAPEAARVLLGLGFHRAVEESATGRALRRLGIAIGVVGRAHSAPWSRAADGVTVDLHHSIPEAPGSPWQALRDHRVTIAVAGAEVDSLDRPASALLIALHAAHHGPRWSRARADLRAACRVLDRDCWRDAALLAHDLRVEPAMGVGLGTVAEGRELARELGLGTRPTLGRLVRWSWIGLTER
jgi:hypothetical protein